MNSVTDFVLISRLEYDYLKKTKSSANSDKRLETCEPTPKSANIDGRAGVIENFPSKFKHVTVRLLDFIEGASKHIELSENYNTIRLLSEDKTYNLKQTLRVLLYEHETFAPDVYSALKRTFIAAGLPQSLVLNQTFAEFLKPTLSKRKATWLSYDAYKKSKKAIWKSFKKILLLVG